MFRTKQAALFGWISTLSLPVWAKTGDPPIELFVIGVAAAAAGGAVAGYFLGKKSGKDGEGDNQK